MTVPAPLIAFQPTSLWARTSCLNRCVDHSSLLAGTNGDANRVIT